MTLNNLPKSGLKPIEGKLYWSLNIGRNALTYRHFEGGWRAFEFIILRYKTPKSEGEAVPHLFRFAFAYWFPIEIL